MATQTTLPAAPASVPVQTAPVKTQATVAVPAAPQQQVTLIGQLQHVDPLVYATLVGAVFVPLLHQYIKKLATFLNAPKHRTTNYFIAGGLQLVVGYLATIQNSGVLTGLHDPALAGLLTSGLTYFLGQNVYGFFVKTNEELQNQTDPVDQALPAVTNP